MPDDFFLTVERDIPAPIEAVFDAWFDPTLMEQWMTPASDVAVEASANPVVGGSFRIVMKGRGREIEHVGEYVVIDRPNRLVFTWKSEPAGDTIITVEFSRLTDRSTRVTLTHSRFATGETREQHRGGWTALLESLARVLELREI